MIQKKKNQSKENEENAKEVETGELKRNYLFIYIF